MKRGNQPKYNIKLSYKNPITKDDILLNYEECINSSILLINSIKEYFTSK